MLKNLLYLAVFSTILVVIVVGLNIYHNFTASTVSSDTSIQVVPITPGFDSTTIQMLKSRTAIPADLQEKIAFPTGQASLPVIERLSPTPTPSTILLNPTSIPESNGASQSAAPEGTNQ